MNSINILVVDDEIETVSYTHLDVYKRQDMFYKILIKYIDFNELEESLS